MNTHAVLPSSSDTLYQLAYISQIKVASSPISPVLNEIQTTSSEENDKNNLTGILCYGSGWFFQYLEGSEQALRQLKENLIRDGRHCNVKFLEFSVLAKRRFSSWSMQLLAPEKNKSIDSQEKKNSALPFNPKQWQLKDWQIFLQQFTPQYPVQKEIDITQSYQLQINTAKRMITQLFEQHQAFFLVQVVLGILTIFSVFLLIFTS